MKSIRVSSESSGTIRPDKKSFGCESKILSEFKYLVKSLINGSRKEDKTETQMIKELDYIQVRVDDMSDIAFLELRAWTKICKDEMIADKLGREKNQLLSTSFSGPI